MHRKFDPTQQLPTDALTEHDGDAGCPARLGGLLCTRHDGHPMPHRAGTLPHGSRVDVVAEWDDDRDTDGRLDAEDDAHRPQGGE